MLGNKTSAEKKNKLRKHQGARSSNMSNKYSTNWVFLVLESQVVSNQHLQELITVSTINVLNPQKSGQMGCWSRVLYNFNWGA